MENALARQSGFRLLRKAELSKFLSATALKELERFGKDLSRKPGSTIFRQGEPAENLYLVLEGSVELRARPPGRRAYRTVEVVGDGCTLGDEAILGEHGYLAGARTLDKVKLMTFSSQAFDRLAETRPEIAIGLLKCAGSCLIQTIRRSAILTQAPAEVALDLLLRELAMDGRGRDGSVPVRITHAQLAGMLHLSRETVSRMLGQMAEIGTVKLSRGVIRVRAVAA